MRWNDSAVVDGERCYMECEEGKTEHSGCFGIVYSHDYVVVEEFVVDYEDECLDNEHKGMIGSLLEFVEGH